MKQTRDASADRLSPNRRKVLVIPACAGSNGTAEDMAPLCR